LILSHSDPQKVMADVMPALDVLSPRLSPKEPQ